MRAIVEDTIDLVIEDADRLGCLPSLQHLHRILDRGTSANAQLRVYNQARAKGASCDDALSEVVRWICETTANVGRERKRKYS